LNFLPWIWPQNQHLQWLHVSSLPVLNVIYWVALVNILWKMVLEKLAKRVLNVKNGI
jgi:hypothetical protein